MYDSFSHIVNVFYPKPITILELAETIRNIIVELTGGRINPPVEVVDKGIPPLFREDEKDRIKVDVSKALKFLGLEGFTNPKDTLRRIIEKRLKS